MELFFEEHKKLWRRRSVRVTVCLLLAYEVILGGILVFSWLEFGTWKEGGSNHADGYRAIRIRQEQARTYGGVLTEEALREMVRDYQKFAESDGARELERTDGSVLNAWLGTLYPELRDSSSYETMANYVNPSKLTGLYERRQDAIEAFLDASGTGVRETQYLLAMNERVEEPFAYLWTNGWGNVLADAVPGLGILLAIGIIVCLAPLFSEEWHQRTGTMLLTMKNGWRGIAGAKILTGFCFTAELFAMMSAAYLVIQWIYLGPEGAQLPIQCIKMLAVAPMTMGEAEAYEFLYLFASAIGFTGLVMFFSAASKSNLISVVCGALLLIVPMLISGYLPYSAQIALELLPLAGSASDIFRTYTISILGRVIFLPYVTPVSAALFAAASIPFALRGWARRQKA